MLRELKSFYKKSGRGHLPWRPPSLKLRRGEVDVYKVLVSELMLQQTQVVRVIPKYKAFLKRFPTFSVLANASLSDVLKEWQGLGYNRRAKFLHQAAKVIVARSDLARSQFTTEFLESLPGIGSYTARAISVFAYNRPEIFIETNIRTVFLHHYFGRGRTSPHNLGGSASQEKIGDKEILVLIEKDFKKSKMEPRDFYAALMDYGSHLKRSGVRINNKSKHYVKQSKFEGSTRQKRAALLRDALSKGASEKELEKLLHS